jgi:hypothetical protein
VNRHHKVQGEYIGRGTPLGNLWSHRDGTPEEFKCKTRHEAIAKFRIWLQLNADNAHAPQIGAELKRLKRLSQKGPLNLVCSCKPAACHGDVVREYLLNMPSLSEEREMLYYAGIGSRQTPDSVLLQMQSIGEQLADRWTVRSGFADGADKAFAFGADKVNGPMQNFVPWQGFNDAPNSREDGRFWYHQMSAEHMNEAYNIARKYHPNWKACSEAAKKMHTRNVFQVLGPDLNTLSDMVICWTPNGSGSGGTGQAIRIARAYAIPVFDIAIEDNQRLLVDFVHKMENL